MLRPEWAQGFYHKLLAYYQTTYQEEDYVNHWDGHADETAQVLPVSASRYGTDAIVGAWFSLARKVRS